MRLTVTCRLPCHPAILYTADFRSKTPLMPIPNASNKELMHLVNMDF